MIEKRRFYIDGAWVAPAEGHDFEVLNPSNEEPVGVISLGTQSDTDAAVAAAGRAFDSWSRSSRDERLQVLTRLLEAYQERSGEMAEIMSLEMGAPIDLARSAQVGAGTWHLKGAIRALKDFEFDQMLGPHAPTDRILHEPVGVAALITPWNWPMNQIALKVAPAIAAGCTMVLKPSEIAPLSALLFAEMVDAAGLRGCSTW